MTDTIRLLTYNIQVAIATRRRWHYLSRGWHHFLPHHSKLDNLLDISKSIEPYDLVCLQELDAGSFRSHHINQLDYLAHHGHFPYWHGQTTRPIGKLAQHSKGIVSRWPLIEAQHHGLPSRIPGRSVQICRLKLNGKIAHVFNVHLSLSKKTQLNQLARLAELAQQHQNVIIMGDFNLCLAEAWEQSALKHTKLQLATDSRLSYPSWKPKRALDSILVGPNFEICQSGVLDWAYSDHLPVWCQVKIG